MGMSHRKLLKRSVKASALIVMIAGAFVLFHQAAKQRMLASLLNAQTQFPTIPVAATVRVLLSGQRKPKRVLQLPDQKELTFERAGPYVQFVVPTFKILAMVMVEYE